MSNTVIKITPAERRTYLIERIKDHPRFGISPKKLIAIYREHFKTELSISSCRGDLEWLASNGHAIGIAKNRDAMRWYPRSSETAPILS